MQDAVDHVIQIVLAGAQIGVFHVLEYPHQLVAPHLQRPFGGAAFLADGLCRRFRDGFVLQHEQMGVDEFEDVGRRVFGYLLAYLAQLAGGFFHGVEEALDLLTDPVARHRAGFRLNVAPGGISTLPMAVLMLVSTPMPCIASVIVLPRSRHG